MNGEIYDKLHKLDNMIRDSATTEGEKDNARRLKAKLCRKYNIDPNTTFTTNRYSNYERPREKPKPSPPPPPPKKPWIWEYVQQQGGAWGVDGKLKINFGEPPCTLKQRQYVEAICKFYGIELPDKNQQITFTCASMFLDRWATKYQNDYRAYRRDYYRQY